MAQENQTKIGVNELLDDIRYVNQLNEVEIQRVGNHIRRQVDKANLTQFVTDFLIDEISTQLGQLAAKVKLTETAMNSLQAMPEPTNRIEKNIKNKTSDQPGKLSFSANQIAGNRNFLPVETSSTGIRYCWSGPDREIQLSFVLNRQTKLEIQIRLFALIKPEYSKQLKVFIDGQHIPHRFFLDGRFFVVSCVLPVSNNTSQTGIKILLPDTHSPSDLGSGQDDRKLGIAISAIGFGAPTSVFTYLLKRLRLKK